MKDTLPNFLLVGAAKSGTTSLYRYLNGHPEIFMSAIKEPLFFTLDSYKRISRNDPRHNVADKKMARMATLEDYQKLFEEVSDQHKAIGEASAPYLYHYDMAISGIKKTLEDPKILIILRNPIERAFSSYNHLLAEGAESVSFERFLENEAQKKRENWDILNYPVSAGMYYLQVKAYQEHFSRVKVILLDDLKDRPSDVLRELFEFLDVRVEFSPDTSKVYNKTARSLNGTTGSTLAAKMFSDKNYLKVIIRKTLGLFLSRQKLSSLGRKGRALVARKPQISSRTRQRLRQEFAEDILNLQTLISRDLSSWT
ncbi:MAG: sulfotransferase [Desulforhopalus sp.]